MRNKKVNCCICMSESCYLDTAIILEKYHVSYYSCSTCGFLQTEEPYWLDEAYSSAIAKSDIGLIGRNIKNSRLCASLIPILYKSNGVYLDYGGGNGMFVRMMRDLGYDFYWADKYAVNQFAIGFEANVSDRYSLVTAFEVFEHIPDPMEMLEELFGYSDTVIFTTRLLPNWSIRPHQWWYFATDTGQHISLYSLESLKFIAKKFNVRLSSNGISFHILSPRTVSSGFLRFLSFSPFASVFSNIINIGRRSLLENDYKQLTGRPFTQS